MINIVNLTPHTITLRGFGPVACDYHGGPGNEPEALCGACGAYPAPFDRSYPSSGVARVVATPGPASGVVWVGGGFLPIHDAPNWGAVEGLPDPTPGTIFVVSAIVAGRCAGREDVVSPGTGPDDGAVRENGQIVAVTRLIRAPRAPYDHRAAVARRLAEVQTEEDEFLAAAIAR